MVKDWLIGRKLYCLIGLGGVHPEESRQARRIGKMFTYGLAIIAIALLFEWQIQLSGGGYVRGWRVFNWAVWLFFLTQFISLFTLILKRGRFVRENWLLIVIILLGLPFVMNYNSAMELIKPLRPLLAIILMVPAIGFLLRFFVDGKLLTSIFGAIVIVVFFGVLVAGVDPSIKNAADGVWWALATVSTVGYGDVVPVTFLGRAIGAVLVILGLGIFVVITANFLALILKEEVKGVKREEREVEEILTELRSLKASQQKMHQEMDALSEKLDRLGKR
ncbi:MAG: two pore domain potassium channel family protein [Coxiellaceae bacterium]|nr:two pore domain potassium channel family protein [Coxiellaceae bacterium]